MCGIITAINLNNNKKFNTVTRTLEQFEKQIDRGIKGFGFVAINSYGLEYYRCKNEDQIRGKLKSMEANPPRILMFHHRQPTSSPNYPHSAHPVHINHEELKYDYYLNHNGSLVGYDKLRTSHEEDGYEYNSVIEGKYGDGETVYERFLDSEALGIEMARFVEGITDGMKIDGKLACFLLQVDKVTNKPIALYYMRNNHRPLAYYRNQAGIFFASKGKGEELAINTLYRLDLGDGFELTTTKLRYYLNEGYVKINPFEEDPQRLPVIYKEDGWEDKLNGWFYEINRIEDILGNNSNEGLNNCVNEITRLLEEGISYEEMIDDWITKGEKEEIEAILYTIDSEITKQRAIMNNLIGSYE